MTTLATIHDETCKVLTTLRSALHPAMQEAGNHALDALADSFATLHTQVCDLEGILDVIESGDGMDYIENRHGDTFVSYESIESAIMRGCDRLNKD